MSSLFFFGTSNITHLFFQFFPTCQVESKVGQGKDRTLLPSGQVHFNLFSCLKVVGPNLMHIHKITSVLAFFSQNIYYFKNVIKQSATFANEIDWNISENFMYTPESRFVQLYQIKFQGLFRSIFNFSRTDNYFYPSLIPPSKLLLHFKLHWTGHPA